MASRYLPFSFSDGQCLPGRLETFVGSLSPHTDGVPRASSRVEPRARDSEFVGTYWMVKRRPIFCLPNLLDGCALNHQGNFWRSPGPLRQVHKLIADLASRPALDMDTK